MGIAVEQPCFDLLTSVLDGEPVGVALARARDLTFVYVNSAFQALMPSIEMVGRAIEDVWPEARACVLEPVERVARTGERWLTRDQEVTVERTPGMPESAFYTLDVSRLPFGGEPHLLVIASETTAEVTARRTGELLSSVVENMSDALFVYDSDLRFTYLNARALRNIGKTLPEVIGKTSPEAFGLDPLPLFEDAFRRTLDERVPVTFEAPSPVRDAMIEVRTYPIPDGGIAAFYTDITERTRVEDELRFRATLLDNVSDAVFVYSAEEADRGTILYVNRAASEQRGYTHEELMGMRLDDLLLDSRRPHVAERIDSLRTGGEAVFESAHRCKDGRVMPLEVHARLMEYRGRHVLLSVARDISERKAAEERAARELEISRQLLDASDSLAKWTDLGGLLNELAKAVLRSTSHARVTIHMWEDRRGTFTVAASQGGNPLPLGEDFPLQRASIPLQEAFREKRSRVIDYDSLTEARRGAAAGRYDAHLALFAPILFRGRLIGSIWVDDSGERHEFSDREVDIVEAIAAQAATAIENARLFEERGRQAAYAEALNRINAAVHSTLEFDVIMDRVVIEAANALGVDATAVHMHESGHWEFRYSHGLPDGLRQRRLTDAEAPLSMSVLRSRAPLIANDVRRDERANVRLMERFDVSSLVGVPLLVRDEVIGVLFAAYLGEKAVLTDAQVDFTIKVAATLALALENARLYETERGIANKLQEALLALPDSIPGISFAHAYRSATEATRVGGDFYDLFTMTDDLVGVTIGDVAGKGLDAAVMTSLVKNTVRAHSSTLDTDPRKVLALTNEIVYRATPSESFVTVFFGVLNKATGRLRFANAGHTTPALAGAEGLRPLPPTGPLLGAFPDVDFDASDACCVSERELLFLYTDGVIEARRGSELYGEGRLFATLEGLEHIEPTEAVMRVIDDVVGFTGGGLQDDLAILALRLDGPAHAHGRGL